MTFKPAIWCPIAIVLSLRFYAICALLLAACEGSSTRITAPPSLGPPSHRVPQEA
jgi:hypothetical protein